MSIDCDKLLTDIPKGLREELLREYRGIAEAYVEGKWKYASLDAGRFCEVAYCIVAGAVAGDFPSAAQKPNNFPEACRKIESKPPIKIGDHSLRVLIPRVLVGMYDVRNNRNVGHVGGEVVANHMDATLAFSNARWVLAEFVRIFHGTTTPEAQSAVDALVQRRVPILWEIDGIKRVLDPNMQMSDRALLLLHSEPGWVPTKTLSEWAKYSNPSAFRTKVLAPLADAILVELDSKNNRAIITPNGIARVEKDLLPTRS